MLKVDKSVAVDLGRTTMVENGLTEADHLEAWITENPGVIDESLMIIVTQFKSWASGDESANERPDILALSSSGELVVIELKRDSDKRVHLQAITYGALAAGFDRQSLASAHAAWWKQSGRGSGDVDEAMKRLQEHVESDWEEEILQLPRLVLVAADYPAQVLTTVQWLADVAPNLTIECHQFQLFCHGDDLFVNFHRLYPVDDLKDRRLRPAIVAAEEARERVATNTRRAKSVKVIHDLGLIPDGADMTLELATLVKPDVISEIDSWLDAAPQRREFTWSPDPTKPLRWAERPDDAFTPSSLRDAVFLAAGVDKASFSAADAWSYRKKNLYTIATEGLSA